MVTATLVIVISPIFAAKESCYTQKQLTKQAVIAPNFCPNSSVTHAFTHPRAYIHTITYSYVKENAEVPHAECEPSSHHKYDNA